VATKEKIRPVFEELQGYLQRAGALDVYNHEIWQHYHRVIALLNELSGEDFSRFRITIIPPNPYQHVSLPEHMDPGEYTAKLTGLIRYLHCKYFRDEPSPFSIHLPTIISRAETRNQSVQMQMIVELTEQLTRNRARFTEGSKERDFIDKVKGPLQSAGSGCTSVAQLILLLLNIAKECGLSVDDLQQVLGK